MKSIKLENRELPLTAKIAIYGTGFSVAGLAIGGSIMAIIREFVPLPPNRIPIWLWPILITLWIPGIVGLIAGYYVIIRYPYISLFMKERESFNQQLKTRQLWVLVGSIFWALAGGLVLLLIGALLIEPDNVILIFTICYFGLECWFAGFLFIRFDSAKHPTVSTLITFSFGIGVIALPIYLPALILGTIRCRKSLTEMESLGGLKSLE